MTDARRPRLHALLPLLLTCLVLVGGGCGSDDDGGGGSGGGDDAAAKELFTSKCGGCHALADAGTSGTFGPNLDELKPEAGRVSAQIAAGGGGMPAGLVTGDDADAVADYVASAAGR